MSKYQKRMKVYYAHYPEVEALIMRCANSVAGGSIGINQTELNQLLEKYCVQPVGTGYLDCICPMNQVAGFLDALQKAGVSVTALTWWHYVSEGQKPYGLGGPKNKFGTGWYSEIGLREDLSDKSITEIRQYLLEEWPHSKKYRKYYTPAFWLDVPDEWNYSEA